MLGTGATLRSIEYMVCVCVFCFFFQAEDGIRDHCVTGVQTCALPICLGGGSANATFTLNMLNEIFNLNLQTEALETYAARLGSDCPFFVRNIPVIASDTGTTLKPLDISQIGRASCRERV